MNLAAVQDTHQDRAVGALTDAGAGIDAAFHPGTVFADAVHDQRGTEADAVADPGLGSRLDRIAADVQDIVLIKGSGCTGTGPVERLALHNG